MYKVKGDIENYEKIICKRANERQKRGRNQSKYSEDEEDC